jgi:hypothetical protein
MSREVVVRRVLATERMREDMVSLPCSLDEATADVATACSLPEHHISFRGRERLSDHMASKFQLSVAPQASK